MYKDVLFDSDMRKHQMHFIRFEGSNVTPVAQNKTSLSARYILDDDANSSLAYGHCNIVGPSD